MFQRNYLKRLNIRFTDPMIRTGLIEWITSGYALKDSDHEVIDAPLVLAQSRLTRFI
ncbi:MAG: hypothetical protein CM1200mP24_06140 [Gammaproteobacteria bacterium]|nr:MAG: hypothetical protein CM1200mP24_06140 [Gammaproteobacteria bacterium]